MPAERQQRSQRLKRLVEIAERDERAGAETLGRLRAELARREAQLGELNAYRRTYAAASRSMPGSTSAHWKDYQSFVGRLDRAIAAQKQLVSDAEAGVGAARDAWMQKRKRSEALKKVFERSRQAEAQAASRREQRRLINDHDIYKARLKRYVVREFTNTRNNARKGLF